MSLVLSKSKVKKIVAKVKSSGNSSELTNSAQESMVLIEPSIETLQKLTLTRTEKRFVAEFEKRNNELVAKQQRGEVSSELTPYQIQKFIKNLPSRTKGHIIVCTCGAHNCWSQYDFIRPHRKGCKHCQGQQLRTFWESRIHPNQLTPEGERRPSSATRRANLARQNVGLWMKNNAGELVQIASAQDMIKFMEENPNEYHNFLLPFCKERGALTFKNIPPSKKNQGLEMHHIQPLTVGGPDVAYNLVCLPAGDHLKAHLYLARVVDESWAYRIVNIMYGNTVKDENTKVSLENIDSLAEKFAQAKKRELELREKRERKALPTLENGRSMRADDYLRQSDTYWSHTELKGKVCVPAGKAKTLKELRDVLAELLPEDSPSRAQMFALASYRDWTNRMSKHFHGRSLGFHGWSWVDSDAEEELLLNSSSSSSNNFSPDTPTEVSAESSSPRHLRVAEAPPDFASTDHNVQVFMSMETPVTCYHARLRNPIVFVPSTLKGSLRQAVVDFFVEEVGKQDKELAENISNINRTDFARAIMLLFTMGKKMSYGFVTDPHNIPINELVLSKKTHWAHSCLDYSKMSPLVIPANSLKFLSELHPFFIQHLENVDLSQDTFIAKTQTLPPSNIRGVTDRKNKVRQDLQNLKRIQRKENLGMAVSKMLKPTYPNITTAYGFYLKDSF